MRSLTIVVDDCPFGATWSESIVHCHYDWLVPGFIHSNVTHLIIQLAHEKAQVVEGVIPESVTHLVVNNIMKVSVPPTVQYLFIDGDSEWVVSKISNIYVSGVSDRYPSFSWKKMTNTREIDFGHRSLYVPSYDVSDDLLDELLQVSQDYHSQISVFVRWIESVLRDKAREGVLHRGSSAIKAIPRQINPDALYRGVRARVTPRVQLSLSHGFLVMRYE